MRNLYSARFSARCGKLRYPTKNDAKLALACCKGSASAQRAECRAYPCTLCEGWHLTSVEKATEITHTLPELERLAKDAKRVGDITARTTLWTQPQQRLFTNASLHALDGSGLPVRAWNNWWMWRALRNYVDDCIGSASFEQLREHLRTLTHLFSKARSINPRGWATPQETLAIARGWSEEQQAWDLPARLWVVAAATI